MVSRIKAVAMCYTRESLEDDKIWQSLSRYFDSVAFKPVDSETIKVEFGNINYRIGITIPGLATDASPDLDLQQVAQQMDQEEDVITLHWKKIAELINGDGDKTDLDQVGNIPFSDSEEDSLTLPTLKVGGVLPECEEKVRVAVSNNHLFLLREKAETRIICKTAMLSPELSQDYFLSTVFPPFRLFPPNEQLNIKLSAEGLLIGATGIEAYCAATAADEDDFYLPKDDTQPVVIESVQIMDASPNPEVVDHSVYQLEDALVLVDKPCNLVLKGSGIVAKPDEVRMCHLNIATIFSKTPEAEIVACQFTTGKILLGVENEYTAAYIILDGGLPIR